MSEYDPTGPDTGSDAAADGIPAGSDVITADYDGQGEITLVDTDHDGNADRALVDVDGDGRYDG